MGDVSPQLPACKRGSGASRFEITTNTRPVIGPAWALAGKEISNFVEDDCWAGTSDDVPSDRNTIARVFAAPLVWIRMFPPNCRKTARMVAQSLRILSEN